MQAIDSIVKRFFKWTRNKIYLFIDSVCHVCWLSWCGICCCFHIYSCTHRGDHWTRLAAMWSYENRFILLISLLQLYYVVVFGPVVTLTAFAFIIMWPGRQYIVFIMVIHFFFRSASAWKWKCKYINLFGVFDCKWRNSKLNFCHRQHSSQRYEWVKREKKSLLE